MSGMKLERVALKNFKCHRKLEEDLKNLTILTGGNAAGKSSLVQGILLAVQSFKEVEKKRIGTNNVYGINLGLPVNLRSEDFSEESVSLSLSLQGEENQVILDLQDANENDIWFEISNWEEIVDQKAGGKNLADLHLFFLNAERQGPRIISSIQNVKSFDVGSMGENTNYLISEMDKQQKLNSGLRLPEELKISKIDRFSANCEEWLNLIIPGTKLQYAVDMEKNLSTVKFQNNGEFYLPTATGFGITYVLPIIVQSLAASILGDSVLIVENPEAHLYPYSQSTIGKFLALTAASGVQVIVETHSEHVVDGCRVQAARTGQCENMKIMFFAKQDHDSVCQNIAVSENGELEEWPEGFFDQKRQDLRELMEMKKCGN